MSEEKGNYFFVAEGDSLVAFVDEPEVDVFGGWDTPHFTPIPDQLFDVWLKRLNGSELKVLLYIMRRTWGFKKSEDTISYSQMEKGIVKSNGVRLDDGAGVAGGTLTPALNGLVRKGLIVKVNRYGTDRSRLTNLYQLHIKR